MCIIDGCFSNQPVEKMDLAAATKVELWSTIYYVLEAPASSTASAVPLRDMRNNVIGPSLSPKNWCLAAIEGTVSIEDTVYNYAGVRNPRQADCSHNPSERVRWDVSQHPFGVGSANNPLVPMTSLACDLGTVSNSTPWLNGGYAKFGQIIYIPDADGVRLPDGTVHDGKFRCDDVGGAITGNHIDVFIGKAAGSADALAKNPFDFITSSRAGTFAAYVLP